jgi:hypothetical protein|tara:strand:- start:158 stop:502 length:345 start_codon:yes stop_codon:yes gene_type:complete
MHLVKKTFTLEALTENDNPIKYKGYLNLKNPLWNGWANPYFTKEVRDKFIADEEKLLGWSEEEVIQELKSIEPTYDSYGTELYYFGQFLCWDMEEDFTEEEIKTIKQYRGVNDG